MKICKKCHVSYNEEDFYSNECKFCHYKRSRKWISENKVAYDKWRANWAREWRKNNPEKNRLIDRKKELKRLGLTIENYNEILKKQKGKCAICGLIFEKENKKPCVDHSHKTGIVRGLLCRTCNLQLGHIEKERIKNFIFFDKAIEYLKSRSTNLLKVKIKSLTK